MILRNNLYKVQLIDASARLCRVRLLPDSVVYGAHFPGMPVTPGVCIIQMAGELLSDITGRRLTLTRVVNAKFLSIINPQAAPDVTVAFDKLAEADGGLLKASASVSGSGTVFAKLSLIFKADD